MRFSIGSLLLILKNTFVVLIEIDNIFKVLGILWVYSNY